jgi:hypothetical protein
MNRISVAVAAASMLAAISPAPTTTLPLLPSAMLGNWCEADMDETSTIYTRADGRDHDGAACEDGGAELTQDAYFTQDIGCGVRYREVIAPWHLPPADDLSRGWPFVDLDCGSAVGCRWPVGGVH